MSIACVYMDTASSVLDYNANPSVDYWFKSIRLTSQTVNKIREIEKLASDSLRNKLLSYNQSFSISISQYDYWRDTVQWSYRP